MVSGLETRVVDCLPFALPAVAPFPFPLVSICPTLSCIHLATSEAFPFLWLVDSPAASMLALEAAAQILQAGLLEQQLPSLQPLRQ